MYLLFVKECIKQSYCSGTYVMEVELPNDMVSSLQDFIDNLQEVLESMNNEIKCALQSLSHFQKFTKNIM